MRPAYDARRLPRSTPHENHTHAPAIDRILHAYRESQVLMTSERLGLFAALHPEGHPVALDTLAAACRVTPESISVLVDALVELGLLEKHPDGYYASPLTAAHLAPGAPYPLNHWVSSEHDKYLGFGGLADALRADPLPDDPDRIARRHRGMTPTQMEGLAEVARARSAETARVCHALHPRTPGRLLDAGGGHGLDAIGVVNHLPGWTAVVADRALPLTGATANIDKYGATGRVTTCECDLDTDDLAAATGGQFDVVLLFMVLGGKPAPEALAVLHRLYAALAPGGWLLMRGNWTDPLREATSALKHMLRPGGRRTLTHERTLELLAEAGFGDVHAVAGEGIEPNAMVAARRP